MEVQKRHPDVDKVVEATKIAQKEYPQFLIDGELQTDARELFQRWQDLKHWTAPAGKANVLIFLIWMQVILVIS